MKISTMKLYIELIWVFSIRMLDILSKEMGYPPRIYFILFFNSLVGFEVQLLK